LYTHIFFVPLAVVVVVVVFPFGALVTVGLCLRVLYRCEMNEGCLFGVVLVAGCIDLTLMITRVTYCDFDIQWYRYVLGRVQNSGVTGRLQ
jgi:hypothetical protein